MQRNVGSLDVEVIAKGISNGSSLRNIDLTMNALTDGEADMTGVKALAHAISVSKSLEVCELGNSNLGKCILHPEAHHASSPSEVSPTNINDETFFSSN